MTLTLYEDPCSGNCYKVRLLLTMQDKPFQAVREDVFSDTHPTPELVALSPMGKVPVLIDNDFVLAESNAILTYLGKGTPFLPDTPRNLGKVMQWMFFEQYYHEPTIAVARKWRKFTPDAPGAKEKADACMEGGNKALAAMEHHLKDFDWFAAGRCTIADIALYAYTHCADEGGFDLDAYPNVQAWLKRVEATPGFVPMKY